ncbi:tripartite tricarboxylate transporter substrate binding protein [Ramlibacter sp. PS3R-8]|uniref:tripartite tricarboxylate transporter substrate binding protein n=1 Tax=Ramlibacter sp. PS3R-8 TaxID=3133437 RepID=UPI0030A7CB21
MSRFPWRAAGNLMLACPVIAFAAAAHAQAGDAASYPGQPVRIVVPFAPGGGTDATARLLAQKLGDKWGKQVIVENRPGGNTVIATQAVARAAADGHTLLFANSTFAINPILSANLPYDAYRDFVPITSVAGGPFLMVVHPSVPADNLKGMLQVLREGKPGEWNFATVGGSGIGRIAGELFALQSGVKLQHISYRGAAQVTTDLLAGTVKLTIDPPNTYIAHVRSGKLKALAVTGKRLASLPDVATFAEQGMPEFDVRFWYGLLAPAGTPKAVVDRISAAVNEILEQPDVKERLAALELETLPSDPGQFQAYLRTETEKFTRVVKAANIKAAE